MQTLAVSRKVNKGHSKVTPSCSAIGSVPDLSVALTLTLLEKCADEPAN